MATDEPATMGQHGGFMIEWLMGVDGVHQIGIAMCSCLLQQQYLLQIQFLLARTGSGRFAATISP